MNREIKFRAWDKEKGMSKPYDLDELTMAYDCGYYTGLYVDFDVLAEDTTQMQYTGLKDSLDNEVYDGDIIKATSVKTGYLAAEFIGKVYWLDGQFQWWITDGTNSPEGTDYDLTWLGYFNHFEVIGNQYENPDLLQS